MYRHFFHKTWQVPLLFLCLVQSLSAQGLLELGVARIAAPGWSVDGVSLALVPLAANEFRLRLWVQRMHLPWLPGWHKIEIHCPRARVDAQRLRCEQGRLRLPGPDGQALTASLSLSYHLRTGELQFSLYGFRPSPGQLRLQGHLRNAHWSVQLQGKDLGLAALQGLLSPLLPVLGGLSDVAGKAGLKATITGHDATPVQGRLQLDVRGMAFNGVNVAEDVNAGLKLDYRRTTQQQLRVQLSLTHGGVYIEPGLQLDGYRPGFTLEAGARPLTLAADLEAPLGTALGKGRIQLKGVTLDHPGVVKLQATGALDQGLAKRVGHLEVHLQSADLGRLYPVYLQPLLLNTGLSTLETAGALDLNLELDRAGLRRVRLSLDGVYADDESGRFRVSGLRGVWAFTSDDEPVASSLHWDGAGIYRLDIGATDLPMVSRRGRLELSAPAAIPILDGRLRIERLRLEHLAQGDVDMRIDGELTPTSLQELTQALGWPLMSGKLSGKVPGLHYGHGTLEVNGGLEVDAFDGRIGIRNLRVADLFGPVPVLDADISIQGLELERLTRTFSFGGISGRLDGAIKGLRLEAWEPLRFDAWLATAKDDDSRHRISQRAVDNLTRIGGGATTGAISRTFLGIFKTFDYDRLGLRCRLRNGVCQMDGVAPAKSGYYIVEHGLLPPWLDIIGYNRSVNWEVLVGRLKAIVQGQAPVLE